jgi:5'(3')-deoxyribonucleotidase
VAINDDRIALFDLDGTGADYDGEMARREVPLRAPGEPIFVGWDDVPDYIKARRDLIKKQPGFWRQLPRLEHGFHVVEKIRQVGFKLHVLTKGPVKTTTAWTEKVEWCQEHLPDADVTITQNKALVYGRVLVDDFPPYFEPWLSVRPRGLVICVAHSWNADFAQGGPKEHPNVIRYDGTNLAAVETALRRAYDRQPGTPG